MGRRRWWWRETTKGRPNISIKDLKDWGYFNEDWKKDLKKYWAIKITYDWCERFLINFCVYDLSIFTIIDIDEESQLWLKIDFFKHACNYWWYRYWFICPNCKKKYAYLYLSSSLHFYCRKCLNLCHPEQNVRKGLRNWRNFLRNRDEADKVYKTIKYKYRNNKMTRKYARYCRLENNFISCMW
jgi:hypothetical protein